MNINRRTLGSGALTLLSSAGLSSGLSACAQSVKPKTKYKNVIFIIADDLGLQLGAYGDEVARTPYLDSLAARSALFENAYVTQSSCSPSRSSMFTGLYPHENGQFGLAHEGFHLKTEVKTIVNELVNHGVYCGDIGKIHVDPMSKFKFDFLDLSYTATRKPDWVLSKLSNFIELSRDAEQRFLTVSLTDPHRPYEGPFDMLPNGPRTPEEVKPPTFIGFDGPALRLHSAGYYNCVERLDYIVGKAMGNLEAAGLLDSALVLFIGDHGPPFVRAKGTAYESGIRIPMLLWTSDMTSGRKISQIVSTLDIAKTVADALGCPWSQGHGESLLALEDLPTRSLVTEFTAHSKVHYFPRRTLRNGQFKLCFNMLKGQKATAGTDAASADIRKALDVNNTAVEHYRAFMFKTPEFELFDLSDDPWERKNLINDKNYAKVVENLKEELRAWQVKTNDPLAGYF